MINLFKSKLEKAIISFHKIADSTGILEENLIEEPNLKERDKLWSITRTFLNRIYELDLIEQMSNDEIREYNQLCHWSIVALHWNDEVENPSFDNGRHRRDTIALAICLYTRMSIKYDDFNKIRETFILPHTYCSLLLWTLISICLLYTSPSPRDRG